MSERILAVIPCLNEESTIGALAEKLAIATQSLPIKIVIADGGSSDRTVGLAEALARAYANITLLRNPKRLQAAAINLAVAEYGGDAEFLIRIDAHADYPADYCQTLIDEAEQTGADSVVVSMTTIGISGFQRAVAAAQNSKLGTGGAAHRAVGTHGMWADHGHHALMRIKAFRAVGGYDETFSHNEDAELDTRLRQAGYKIWLTGRTAIIYYPRATPVALFRQYMHHGEGRARNILKHKTMPKLRQLAPATVLPAALLALLTPISSIFALPIAIWAVFCLAYGLLLGWQAKDPLIALSGPAAMIMHCGWSVGFWRSMLSQFLSARGGDT
jgi:succinoglycan biosynthesis protein ExoA